MTPVFDLGGHRLTVTEDHYADGRKCIVAEHPDIPGCVAYADTAEEAMANLREARAAFDASLRRHEGGTPRAFRIIESTLTPGQLQIA